jgi:hypothetical protein
MTKKIEISSMNDMLYIDKYVFWSESDIEKLPDVSFIPPMLRRRMTNIEKIAVSLAFQIAPENHDYVTVFASRFGEWEQTIRLIKQFYFDNEMSPAGFSNSVHNAAAGHLSLLTHNKKSYTSIAAGERTLEMGLLEALTTKKPALFIYVEESAPVEYAHMFSKKFLAHGMACFITNTGKNGYEFVKKGEKIEPLTFTEFQKILSDGNDIKASCWGLVKK